MIYQKLINEIENLKTSISNIGKKIKSIDSKIGETIKSIDTKFLSISIEGVLLHLPNNVFGSKIFGQKLNSQVELYQDTQLNKIIRFLSLVEDIENDYNLSYSALGKSYLKTPKKNEAESLVSKYNLIKNEYKLMIVLLEAIKSDKVLFNKIYNLLEDRGVFLSVYDKMNFNNLSKIASNMTTLVEQSFLTNEYLKSINTELWAVNTNLDNINNAQGYMNDSLENINDSLGELDSSVKAGNFLSAIQTYELYKINKNTKNINK